MSMQRIGLALLLLATSFVALSYGAQAQASSGTGMDNEMTHGSMSKSQNKALHKYKITLHTEPEPAKGAQENTFHVNVTDPSGKPLSDANVKLTLVMPAMPSMGMAEMRASADLAWNGSDYVGKAKIPTAGPWNVNVQVLKQNRVIASEKTKLVAK